MITDKLKSYAAAKKEIIPEIAYRQHTGLNNWAEVFHQPTRQKERQTHRFKSTKQAQRFLSAHTHINNPFHCRRHTISRNDYCSVSAQAFHMWQSATHTSVAPRV